MLSDSEIRKKVKRFQKEYGLTRPDSDGLCRAIEKQGYTIVEFNNVSNDSNVTALAEALRVTQNIALSKGFTFVNQNYRIVFVHEDMSEEEKLIVLSHEQGHIYLGHLNSASFIGKDIGEEYEANEFAHYLLNPSGSEKAALGLRKHRKAAAVTAAALIIAICGVFAANAVRSNNVYYGEYYVTETGGKYHTKDCSFIAGKKNLHRLTKEEYDSGQYEPCRVCVTD